MASLYELFGSEKNLEDDGAWIPFKECKFSDGTCPEFRIKRIGGTNCPFNREYEKLIAPHRKRMRKMRGGGEDVSAEIEAWAVLKAFKDKALVEWRNVPKDFRTTNEKGELLAYNKENVDYFFEKMPGAAAVLISEATELKYYQDECRDEDSKN